MYAELTVMQAKIGKRATEQLCHTIASILNTRFVWGVCGLFVYRKKKAYGAHTLDS